MAKRNPNGYGGVTKLKGNRRKPYMAYVSEMSAKGTIIPQKEKKALQAKINSLQDMDDTRDMAIAASIIKYEIDLLSSGNSLDLEQYRHDHVKQLANYIKQNEFRGYQQKIPIGYYATAKEANIALAEYNKSPYSLDGKKTTFAEVYSMAYDDAKVCRKAASTQNSYKQGFNKCKAIHGTPIADIRLPHLTGIMDGVDGTSASLQNRVITVLKMVFSYSLKNDLVEKDYSQFLKIGDVKESKKKQAYSREEVAMLWDNMDWEYRSTGRVVAAVDGEKVAEILLLLCYTGMRIEELLSLKTESVHPDGGYINLMGTKTKAAQRIVPIHHSIMPIIKRRYGEKNEFLIADRHKNRIKYESFKDVAFKAFCNEFKFSHTIHETRHTFATFSKSSNMDTALRAFIIGHRNDNITDDTYTHPEALLPELKAEMNKLKIVETD